MASGAIPVFLAEANEEYFEKAAYLTGIHSSDTDNGKE